MTGDPVADAESLIGYRFRNRELLRAALIHCSFAEERGCGEDYDRLEFLGDSVLELVTREYLLDEFPDDDEGDLTRRKIAIVQKKSLAAQCLRIGLDRLVLVGEGFSWSRASRESIAADVMEAVIGAVYLDGGLEESRKFIVREILDRVSSVEMVDPEPRNRLQEYCQARGMDLPEYVVVNRTGPDHAPCFEVRVSVEGKDMGVGRGATKKSARNEAAAEALENIERTGLK